MRVIAGKVRGHKLIAPPGNQVRPTLDRVKESVFNSLSPLLYGCTFLDLFSGSGAMGIEALSRGACRVVFVESAPESIACIERNIAFTRMQAQSVIIQKDAASAWPLIKTHGPFDLVYMDPPYAYPNIVETVKSIVSNEIIKDSGFILIEHSIQYDLAGLQAVSCLTHTKSKKYSKTMVSHYKFCSTPTIGGTYDESSISWKL